MKNIFHKFIEYLRMNSKICVMIGCKSYFEDSGYAICACGNNEGCDYMFWHVGIFNIPKIIIRKEFFIVKHYLSKYFSKCYDCNKFDRVFGKNIGKHEKCVPF